MPYRENADRCRRLAREVMGDPMEFALLRLAQEFEARARDAQPAPGFDGSGEAFMPAV